MKLPNFMCLGAAKSGTTSLYDILIQHPEIYIPQFKEPHFFDVSENFANGLEWYKKNYFQKANQKIIADFTPSYFFDSNAPKRIFDSLGPKMKFLVILRNPVDRAYSHYLHSKRDFHESNDFLEALASEEIRIKKYIKKSDYFSYLRHSYVNQGLYSKMLDRYLKYYSLDKFLFINFEDEFVKEKDATIKKILSFLNVDESITLNTNFKSNVASKAISKRLKKIMKNKSWFRKIIKYLIPSFTIRQILRNKIHKLNNTSFQPKELSDDSKFRILAKYFKKDIVNLETILNKDMNW